MRGKFIVVEGLDGSGKTTQAGWLAEALRGRGRAVSLSAEPTGGPVGALARQVLMRRLHTDPRTFAALFAADRLDHLHNPVNGVIKHLDEGVIEVSDRYDLSSYAYQVVAGVDEDWLWQINSQALRPDLTLFIDVDPAECARRLAQRHIEQDLYHEAERLTLVRGRYLAAIERLRRTTGEPIAQVDGSADPQTVHARVMDVVGAMLEI